MSNSGNTGVAFGPEHYEGILKITEFFMMMAQALNVRDREQYCLAHGTLAREHTFLSNFFWSHGDQDIRMDFLVYRLSVEKIFSNESSMRDAQGLCMSVSLGFLRVFESNLAPYLKKYRLPMISAPVDRSKMN